MNIHGYEDSEISMDIHGYPPKNGLNMDMDMDAIFHLHGNPVSPSLRMSANLIRRLGGQKTINIGIAFCTS